MFPKFSFVRSQKRRPSLPRNVSIEGSNIETQEKGTVKFAIYKQYWKAVGVLLSPAILLSLLAMQITRNLTGVRHFHKGDLPSLPSDNLPIVATSQMFNFSSGNFPKVRLGLLRHRRLQSDRLLLLELARWLSAAARTDLVSFRLINSTFGKLALKKRPLLKYLTSSNRCMVSTLG